MCSKDEIVAGTQEVRGACESMRWLLTGRERCMVCARTWDGYTKARRSVGCVRKREMVNRGRTKCGGVRKARANCTQAKRSARARRKE